VVQFSQLKLILTERELDVLKLVAQELTNQEIAEILFISEWTVGNHIDNILGNLRSDLSCLPCPQPLHLLTARQ